MTCKSLRMHVPETQLNIAKEAVTDPMRRAANADSLHAALAGACLTQHHQRWAMAGEIYWTPWNAREGHTRQGRSVWCSVLRLLCLSNVQYLLIFVSGLNTKRAQLYDCYLHELAHFSAHTSLPPTRTRLQYMWVRTHATARRPHKD